MMKQAKSHKNLICHENKLMQITCLLIGKTFIYPKTCLKLKSRMSIMITGLLLSGLILAQTGDTLTNNSIIKMARARLSDDLIIDVIKSSPVAFDLGENSIRALTEEHVSLQVIETMRNAVNKPSAPVIKDDPVQQPKVDRITAVPVRDISSNKPDVQPQFLQVVEALGYISPLKELVAFYEKEYKSIEEAVTGWDDKIKNTLSEVSNINEQILQTETELRNKKNADAKAFSSEITDLKKQLSASRTKYKELKNKMSADGEAITEKLSGMSSDLVRSMGKKYDEVSQLVKSASTNPAKGENVVPVTFTALQINNSISFYIKPVIEMLYWHQNEIDEVQKTITEWNPKVKEVVQKDAELAKKLEPIQNLLKEYQSNTKKYKTEIATLKKQSSEIEKERKLLADQMANDSKELAAYLKNSSSKIQEIIEQRFADIISNINYYYQEKLNL
jgi:peptidoglycan hydrolase CwlO-like protein